MHYSILKHIFNWVISASYTSAFSELPTTPGGHPKKKFEPGGTKLFILILLIYYPILCAIVNLITCTLYHQNVMEQTFPTVYVTSL